MYEVLVQAVFWFFIYSCIGWCVEVVFAAVK